MTGEYGGIKVKTVLPYDRTRPQICREGEFFSGGGVPDEIVSHGSCPEELKHGGMKLWQKAVTVRPSRLKSPEARPRVCMSNRPERKGKSRWFGRELEKT